MNGFTPIKLFKELKEDSKDFVTRAIWKELEDDLKKTMEKQSNSVTEDMFNKAI